MLVTYLIFATISKSYRAILEYADFKSTLNNIANIVLLSFQNKHLDLFLISEISSANNFFSCWGDQIFEW